MHDGRKVNEVWRRGWDSNPRKLALHALSKRADSAALAPLRIVIACDCITRTTAGYRRTHSRFVTPRCRSAVLTDGISVWSNVTSSSEVAVGSCATDTRESGQVRKEAAFIGSARVPQIAWPSLQSAKRFGSLPEFCDTPFGCQLRESRGRARPLPLIDAADVDRVDKRCKNAE